MKNVFGLIVVVAFLIGCSSEQNPSGSDEHENDTLKVVDVQAAIDTVVSYGDYPDLPSQVKALMSDNSFRSIPIEWNTCLDPTTPGKYRVAGYYNIKKEKDNGNLDSIIRNIEVRDTEFQLSKSDILKKYLCQDYIDTGVFWGAVINKDSMTYHEQYIDKIQYIFRIIESEEERLQFQRYAKCFAGADFDICSNNVQEGQIELVILFIYRYKTIKADGLLHFNSREADSLYKYAPEIFKMLYGKMYSCEGTLGRFSYAEWILEPKSILMDSVEMNLDNLKKSLDLGSNKMVDLSAFYTPYARNSCSLPFDFFNFFFFDKTIRHYYDYFKNVVDSCKTTEDYFILNPKYRSFYPE